MQRPLFYPVQIAQTEIAQGTVESAWFQGDFEAVGFIVDAQGPIWIWFMVRCNPRVLVGLEDECRLLTSLTA